MCFLWYGQEKIPIDYQNTFVEKINQVEKFASGLKIPWYCLCIKFIKMNTRGKWNYIVQYLYNSIAAEFFTSLNYL